QAKKATSVIPIVLALSGDPVGAGLVASLAQPGGNITGLSMQWPDAAGKRLALLREVVPGLRPLAIMANGEYPTPRRKCARFKSPHARLVSMRRLSKSDAPRTLHPPSRRSRIVRMHSMWSATRS